MGSYAVLNNCEALSNSNSTSDNDQLHLWHLQVQQPLHQGLPTTYFCLAHGTCTGVGNATADD